MDEHVRGACNNCKSPIYGRKTWGAKWRGAKFALDRWQMDLLHQYAQLAEMGAAEPIDLEV